MIAYDLLHNSYILFKNDYKKFRYWNEHANGYTDEQAYAGVYTKKEVEDFRIRILSKEDIKSKKHYHFTHFAMKLADALKISL